MKSFAYSILINSVIAANPRRVLGGGACKLEEKGSQVDIPLIFKQGSGIVDANSGYIDFVVPEDTKDTDCLPTSCSFTTVGSCNSNFVQSLNQMTMKSPSSNGQFTVDTTNLQTTASNFCFYCINDDDDAAKVKDQTIYITSDGTSNEVCQSQYSILTYADTTENYNSNGNDKELGKDDDFFDLAQNAPKEICDITTCSLYLYPGCSSQIDTNHLYYANSRIEAKQVALGYKYDVCVKCTNSYGLSIAINYAWNVEMVGVCNTLSNPSSKTDVVKDYSSAISSETITISSSNMDTYFQNSDTSNCPILSCSLYQSGCSTLFSSTHVTMGSASPWTITMDMTVTAGYDYTLCVKCTNGQQSAQMDNWSVKLNALSCSSAFTSGATPQTVTLSYQAGTSSSSTVVPTSTFSNWNTYFSNTLLAACPITSCAIRAKDDCDSSTAWAFSSHVYIESVSPFSVKAYQNILAGYGYQVCIKCSTADGSSISMNDWTIKQESACLTSMTVPSSSSISTKTITAAKLSESTSEVVWPTSATNWNTVFSNSLSTDCPITSCGISNAGSCGTGTLSNLCGGVQLQIGTSSPWQVTAQRTCDVGYTHTVCVRCTNGQQDVDLDNWSIVQTANPCPSNSLTTQVGLNRQVAYVSGSVTPVQLIPSDTAATWDIFFSSTVGCSITSCAAYNSGSCGSTVLSSSYVTWDSTILKILAQNSVTQGYTILICIRCSNEYQNVDMDSWQIQQTSKCSSSMSDASIATTSITFAKLSETQTQVVWPSSATSWETVFANSETTDCPIVSCAIYDQDSCGTGSLTPQCGGSNIQMGAGGGYQITMTKNCAAGYTYQVCIQCQNGNQIAKLNGWTITQTASPCNNKISSGTLQNTQISFVDGGSTELVFPSSSVTTWDAFFNQADIANCAIISCSIWNAGQCGVTSYSGSHITYDSSSKTVRAANKITAGYTISLCVRCTNDYDIVDQDNWQIVQTADVCLNSLTSVSGPYTSSLAYQAGGSDTLISPNSDTWDSLFTNTAGCTITQCYLYDYSSGSCQISTFTHGAYISMVSNQVMAKVTETAGYSVKVCVRCENRGGNADLDNWTITQSAIPAIDCSNTLTSSSVNTLTLAYSDVVPTTTLSFSWDTLLANTQPTLCPITSCNIWPSGSCGSGSFSGISHLTLDPSSLSLTATVNELLGYTYLACVRCQNAGGAQADYDQWQITLQGMQCGLESIMLKSKSDKIVSSIIQSSSVKTIPFSQFSDKFYSTISGCAITTYRIVSLNTDGSYSAYSGTDVSLDSSLNLIIDCSKTKILTLYLEAASDTSLINAYLPLFITVDNLAPFFVDGPPETQQIIIDSTGEFTYNVPEYQDLEGDDVSVIFTGLEDFMVINEGNQSITFLGLDESKVGSYTIEIQLKDSNGNDQKFQQEFQVSIESVQQQEQEIFQEFVIDVIVEEIEVQEQNFTKEETTTKICTAKIESISQLGEMVVLFSTQMKTEFINITWINSTFLDLYIVPAEDRQHADGFNLQSVNFTWNVTEYNDYPLQNFPIISQMVFKLEFLEPLQISPLFVQDSLVLHIKDKGQFFISKTLNKDLDDEYVTLKSKVTRQMIDNSFTQNFKMGSESGSDGLKGMMLVSFAINLVLSGAMQFLVGWINSLQLIIHLPMLMILIPANVAMFFNLILPIVQFDLIPPEWSYELFLTFDDEPDKEFVESFEISIFDQMQDLGYDSHNSLRLLGSLFIMNVVYYARVIILYPFILCVVKLFKIGEDYRMKLKSQIFFNEIIILNIEAYLELLIAAFINYNFSLNTTDGEIFGTIVSYHAIVICIVVMPAISIWVVAQDMETIRSGSFEFNWGAFYEDIQTKQKSQIFYNVVFMARRFFFLVICFYLSRFPGLQIVYLNFLNLFCLIYSGMNMPFTTRFKNRIELFNEITVLVCSFHMMTYTDFVGDVDTINTMGWSLIATIVFNCIVNLFIILFVGAKSIYLIGLKYYKRIKAKVAPEKKSTPRLQNEEDRQEFFELFEQRKVLSKRLQDQIIKMEEKRRKRRLKEQIRARKIELEQRQRQHEEVAMKVLEEAKEEKTRYKPQMPTFGDQNQAEIKRKESLKQHIWTYEDSKNQFARKKIIPSKEVETTSFKPPSNRLGANPRRNANFSISDIEPQYPNAISHFQPPAFLAELHAIAAKECHIEENEHVKTDKNTWIRNVDLRQYQQQRPWIKQNIFK